MTSPPVCRRSLKSFVLLQGLNEGYQEATAAVCPWRPQLLFLSLVHGGACSTMCSQSLSFQVLMQWGEDLCPALHPPPPNSPVGILTSSVIVLGGGTFRDHESRAPWWNRCLSKEPQRTLSTPFCHAGNTIEGGSLPSLERPLGRTQLCCHLDLELLVFRNWEEQISAFNSHPAYGIYFQTPEWLKTQVRRMLTSHLK